MSLELKEMLKLIAKSIGGEINKAVNIVQVQNELDNTVWLEQPIVECLLDSEYGFDAEKEKV